MTNDLFERLLYEEESATLDFKRDQYRFVRATDEEKSELLKDILGFTNGWRRAPAYILIGVEDVRGGMGNVVGIPAADQLADHSLQQFVNNLTNQPIQFHYEAFTFDGKHVGIIQIEEQPRPFFLKKDYGKLKKNEVYVRRGSSTDPTKPASPDEIAKMGLGASHPVAEISVEFAKLDADGSLGTRIECQTEFCETPSAESIPDLARPRQHYRGIALPDLSDFGRGERLNPDYYRELAAYEFSRRLMQPVQILITNTGTVAANRVRVEIDIERTDSLIVFDSWDKPHLPKRTIGVLNTEAFDRMKPVSAFRRDPGDLSIDKNDQRHRLVIDCRDIQPGRSIRSDTFYVARAESGEILLSGQVFADNLPKPVPFVLTISMDVDGRSMTVDDLLNLEDAEQ